MGIHSTLEKEFTKKVRQSFTPDTKWVSDPPPTVSGV